MHQIDQPTVSSHRYTNITMCILTAIPILYAWSFINVIHTIPNGDYWPLFFENVLKKIGPAERLLSLLTTRCNDHFIVIPNILFYINYLITHGNNIGLFVIDGIIMLSIMGILVTWVKRSFDKKYWIFLIPLLSLILFAPITSQSWLRSMSGVIWFTANLMIIITIDLFTKFLKAENKTGLFIGLCVSSFFCVITYSSALAIFALIFSLFLLYTARFKQKELVPYLIAYMLITIIVYTLWMWDYSNRGHATRFLLSKSAFRLQRTAAYILMYFGSIFTDNKDISIIYGATGLCGYLISAVFLIRRFFQKANEAATLVIMPWFLLNSATIMFAIFISQTRYIYRPPKLNMFVSFARYNHITVLYWLGLILILIIGVSCIKFKKRITKYALWTGVSSLLLFLCFSIYNTGLRQHKLVLERYRYAEYANLSLQLSIVDEKQLKSYFPRQFQFANISSYIKDIKSLSHVPLHEKLIPEYLYNSILDTTSATAATSNTYRGTLAYGKRIGDLSFMVVGSVNSEEENDNNPIKHILLTNEQRQLRGAGVLDRFDRGVWRGYVQLPDKDSGREIVAAYARMADGTLSQFEGNFTMEYTPTESSKKK